MNSCFPTHLRPSWEDRSSLTLHILVGYRGIIFAFGLFLFLKKLASQDYIVRMIVMVKELNPDTGKHLGRKEELKTTPIGSDLDPVGKTQPLLGVTEVTSLQGSLWGR